MVPIKDYETLDRVTGVFARGGYNLMGLVGRPGLAKSRSLKAAVEESSRDHLWVANTVSAFRLYLDLYHRRDAAMLVIDDVDAFYSDRALVRLLKGLCETEEIKRIAWHTDAARLGQEGVPREFTTAIRVAIVANDLKRLNANVRSLEDRGRVFQFEPDAAEVHARAASWFDDPEILSFVGDRLGLLNGRLSLRDYRKAAEDKAAGLDWRGILLDEKGIDDEALVLDRLISMPFPTEEARAAEYRRLTGLSRATYFRRRRPVSRPA